MPHTGALKRAPVFFFTASQPLSAAGVRTNLVIFTKKEAVKVFYLLFAPKIIFRQSFA